MRKGLSVAKTKAKLLIAQINDGIKECRERQKLGVPRENDGEIATWAEIIESDFHDGVFPWQTAEVIIIHFLFLIVTNYSPYYFTDTTQSYPGKISI